MTIVYASSSLQEVIELADNIYVLDQGQLAFSGTPRTILQRADEVVALDITLPEATQIALTLREIMPNIRTDVVDIAELEAEIVANAQQVSKLC